MNSNIAQQTRWIGERWNEYWFTPGDGKALARVRLLVCIVAALWFAMLLARPEWWFGDEGWYAVDISRMLSVEADGNWAARFRMSPLWGTSQRWIFQVWSCVGIVLALCAALGLGGRALVAALFFCTLFLSQRLSWTIGTLEPALIATLGYLIINPGRSGFFQGRSKPVASWNATLTTRLLQVHTWMLCVAALASQASHSIWWRGEAVWWLAETSHSNIFTSDMLRGRILLINGLSHLITLSALIAMMTLLSVRFRSIGVVGGCILGLAYALVADQTLYGILLISLMISLFGGRDSQTRDHQSPR